MHTGSRRMGWLRLLLLLVAHPGSFCISSAATAALTPVCSSSEVVHSPRRVVTRAVMLGHAVDLWPGRDFRSNASFASELAKNQLRIDLECPFWASTRCFARAAAPEGV